MWWEIIKCTNISTYGLNSWIPFSQVIHICIGKASIKYCVGYYICWINAIEIKEHPYKHLKHAMSNVCNCSILQQKIAPGAPSLRETSTLTIQIRTRIRNYIHVKQLAAITHPCHNLSSSEVRAVEHNYTLHKDMHVINYAYHDFS